ncbi:ion channel [Mesorhizobium sp. M0058]|uniref:ion channel n=1 Tax=Mesorhizobium sp. M0058 TaxID=2956865 RepID=UPI00333AC76A
MPQAKMAALAHLRHATPQFEGHSQDGILRLTFDRKLSKMQSPPSWGSSMVDAFFQLKGKTAVFKDSEALFARLADPNLSTVANSWYEPDLLQSPIAPRIWRIRDKHFSNFSLSKTDVKDIEFKNCAFKDCLFIGSTFTNCRFTDCTFTNCNVHRFELRDVFVHPKTFAKCIPSKKYANIGVHLFQELLRNSRMQAQPDYADEAQYMFRRWQRLLNEDELAKVPNGRKPWKVAAIAGAWTFEFFLGSGVRLRNLAGTTIGLLLALTTIHWMFRRELGLAGTESNIQNLCDAFYFTAVTFTTLGYGDITPTTEIGRVVIGLEALLGFVLLATLASTVFRKFSS